MKTLKTPALKVQEEVGTDDEFFEGRVRAIRFHAVTWLCLCVHGSVGNVSYVTAPSLHLHKES